MSETAPSPLKILIADDEANIRRILETRLAMQGHAVAAAKDGAEALELFRSVVPDVVVLDVMMPELDGFAVLERIRAQSEVPIILLTALGDVADRITGLQLGADDYMVKPFSPKELEVRIATILRRVGRGSATTEPRDVPAGNGVLRLGDLVVDTNRRQVTRDGERIGKLQDVYVDVETDEPQFGTVKEGFIGRHLRKQLEKVSVSREGVVIAGGLDFIMIKRSVHHRAPNQDQLCQLLWTLH